MIEEKELQREERLSLSSKRDMFYETFRTNLRLLRNYRGLSAVELANEMSLRVGGGKHILDIEYGRTTPTTDEIVEFSKHFKVSIGDMLEREAKVTFVDEINAIAYVVMKPEIYKT